MRTTRQSCLTLFATALAALLFAGPAVARTATQSASAALSGGGEVTARLSYQPHPSYDGAIRLTIVRDGQTRFSGPVTSSACPSLCRVGQAPDTLGVHVVELAASAEPEVFIDLYSGGAHCCSVTNFYTYDPSTASYRRLVYDWGDPGYELKRIGGVETFETADDRFAYAFTDFAGSGLPIQLLSFRDGRLVNVTRQHPALVRADAANWLAAYRSDGRSDHWQDSVGTIAAWAADEDLLGQSAMVARYLDAQAAAGHLHTGLSGLPSGSRFVATLDRFLKHTGYLG